MGNWKFTIGSNRFLNQRLNHFLLFLCASLPATAPVLSWPFPLNKIMCRPCSHWPSNVTTPYSQSVTIGKNSISLTLQTQTFTKSLTFVSKARSFVQIGEWILNQRLERSMFWKAKWEILKSGLIFIISFSAFITCSCRFRGLHFLFTNLRSKKKKKVEITLEFGGSFSQIWCSLWFHVPYSSFSLQVWRLHYDLWHTYTQAPTVDTFPIVNLDLSVYRSFSLMTMMGKVECDDPWWLGAWDVCGGVTVHGCWEG